MRDPKRITPYCDALASIWSVFSDWRLSPFMINAIAAYINEHGVDPFYMEDEQFLNYLSEYANEVKSYAEGRR